MDDIRTLDLRQQTKLLLFGGGGGRSVAGVSSVGNQYFMFRMNFVNYIDTYQYNKVFSIFNMQAHFMLNRNVFWRRVM